MTAPLEAGWTALPITGGRPGGPPIWKTERSLLWVTAKHSTGGRMSGRAARAPLELVKRFLDGHGVSVLELSIPLFGRQGGAGGFGEPLQEPVGAGV